jgi:hypothetical protein
MVSITSVNMTSRETKHSHLGLFPGYRFLALSLAYLQKRINGRNEAMFDICQSGNSKEAMPARLSVRARNRGIRFWIFHLSISVDAEHILPYAEKSLRIKIISPSVTALTFSIILYRL